MVLILTGQHRSGTTLTRSILSSHPEIELTLEFGNFMSFDISKMAYTWFILKRLWLKRNSPIRESDFACREKFKGLCMIKNLRFVIKYLARINTQKTNMVDIPTIGTALLSLFPGARYVGDKYPDHAFNLKPLVLADGVRCIYIYRDPRDVASSSVIKARSIWSSYWPDEMKIAGKIAERWLAIMKQMEQYRKQIHLIRYEQLVTDPQTVMGELADWLEVDQSGFRYEQVRPDSIGKYVRTLTAEEIDDVIDVAGQKMRELGYDY